jgi:hypothetical protein
MTLKRNAHSGFVMACLAAMGSPLGPVVAQESLQQDAIASGLTENGMVEAKVVEASRKDDILTIKIRFVPVVEGSDYRETIYNDISEENIYVFSGSKKYLLLQDSEGKPFASPELEIEVEEGHPFAGYWFGRFTAPPQQVSEVSLTIPGVEPIEPIAIADR